MKLLLQTLILVHITLFMETSVFASTQTTETLPTLLLVIQPDNGLNTIETTLLEELQLDDGFSTVKTSKRFTSQALANRIAEIRPIAASQKCNFILWLDKLDEKTVSLQLIVIAQGRSSVQTVEASINADVAGNLAISTKELLDDLIWSKKHASTQISAPQTPKPTIDKNTPNREPSDRTSVAPTLDSQSVSKYNWYLHLEAICSASMARSGTQLLLPGVGVGLGMQFVKGFFADISVEYFARKNINHLEATLHIQSVRPGFGAGYLFGSNRWAMGPGLKIQVPWQWTQAVLANQTDQKSWWNLRINPALWLLFRPSSTIMIFIRPAIGLHLKSVTISRRSDNALLYKSQTAQWNLSCGVILNF